MLIKIDENIVVEIDTEALRSRVYHLKNIQQDIADIDAKIAALPGTVSDKELLAWAKLNYPFMDYAAEKAEYLERREKLQSIVDSIGVEFIKTR